jgi:hypothetical protein
VEYGLKGIEVFYPEHSPPEVAHYKWLAERYGLVMTGGTDYHGLERSDLNIGVGRGEMKIPYSIVENLRNRIQSGCAAREGAR